MSPLAPIATAIIHLFYALTCSGVHQVELAYQNFNSYLKEVSWTLVYVAPEPVKSLQVNLVHYKKDGSGKFSSDQTLNTAQIPPTKSPNCYTIRVRYNSNHTEITWDSGSANSTSVPLPANHLIYKRLHPESPGKYILWIGADAQTKPTMENAYEYLALEVGDAEKPLSK